MIENIHAYYIDGDLNSIVAEINSVLYRSDIFINAGSNVYVVFSDETKINSFDSGSMTRRDVVVKKTRDNDRLISIDII